MFSFQGQQIRGVIFDMDGVIADTEMAHQHAWGKFIGNHAIDEEPEAFLRRVFGLGNPEIFRDLYPELSENPAKLTELAEEKEEYFRQLLHAGEVQLIPGLSEFLELLQNRGVAVALGSSAPRKNVDAVLAYFFIKDYFQVIVTGDDVEKAKPDPAIFNLCRSRLGLAADQCVVFEDSKFGLQAARRAGCHVVGLATTHNAEEIAPLADLVVSNFAELYLKLTP